MDYLILHNLDMSEDNSKDAPLSGESENALSNGGQVQQHDSSVLATDTPNANGGKGGDGGKTSKSSNGGGPQKSPGQSSSHRGSHRRSHKSTSKDRDRREVVSAGSVTQFLADFRKEQSESQRIMIEEMSQNFDAKFDAKFEALKNALTPAVAMASPHRSEENDQATEHPIDDGLDEEDSYYGKFSSDEGELKDSDQGEGEEQLLTHPSKDDSFECEEEVDLDSFSKENKRKMTRQLLMKNAGCKEVPLSKLKLNRKNLAKPGTSTESNMEQLSRLLTGKNSEKETEWSPESKLSKHFANAPTFVKAKKATVVDLDQQQVDLVEKFFRAEKPTKLTAYSEESFKVLKVDPQFNFLLEVPDCDEFVKYVVRSSVPASSIINEGYKSKMWRSFERDLKKVHLASKVGIMAAAVNQKITYNQMELLETWKTDGVITDEQFNDMKELSVASFDSTNRSMEQAARAGGLAHQLRRKVILEDLSVPLTMQGSYLNLPLTAEGILGRDFDEYLQSTVDSRKKFKHSAAAMGLVQNQKSNKRKLSVVVSNAGSAGSAPKQPKYQRNKSSKDKKPSTWNNYSSGGYSQQQQQKKPLFGRPNKKQSS